MDSGSSGDTATVCKAVCDRHNYGNLFRWKFLHAYKKFEDLNQLKTVNKIIKSIEKNLVIQIFI